MQPVPVRMPRGRRVHRGVQRVRRRASVRRRQRRGARAGVPRDASGATNRTVAAAARRSRASATAYWARTTTAGTQVPITTTEPRSLLLE